MMNFKKQMMMTLVGISVLGSFQGVQAVLPEFADVNLARESMPQGGAVLSRTFVALSANEWGNRSDLSGLWAPVHVLEDDSSLREEVLALLNRDLPFYQAALSCDVNAGTHASPWWMPWRSGLKKIVGFDTKEGHVTGLIEDAIALVESQPTLKALFSDDIAEVSGQPANVVTQLKTLGLYIDFVQRQHRGFSVMRGQFPVMLGHFFAPYTGGKNCHAEHLPSTALVRGSEDALMLPNRGFVFGGNNVYDQFFMGDSSSWVSYLTQSSQRLSTAVVCAAVEPIANQSSDMQEYVDIFNGDFQSVSLEDMQPGDMLAWCGAPKHAAIVVGWADAAHTKVYASDNRRADSKAYEGPELREIELNWNTGLHVVRRIEVTSVFVPSAEAQADAKLAAAAKAGTDVEGKQALAADADAKAVADANLIADTRALVAEAQANVEARQSIAALAAEALVVETQAVEAQADAKLTVAAKEVTDAHAKLAADAKAVADVEGKQALAADAKAVADANLIADTRALVAEAQANVEARQSIAALAAVALVVEAQAVEAQADAKLTVAAKEVTDAQGAESAATSSAKSTPNSEL
jgi:hypothetical protein